VRRLSRFATLGLAALVGGCAGATPSPSPSRTVAITPAPATAAIISSPIPVAELPDVLRDILRAPGPFRMTMDRRQTSDTATSRILGTMRITPDAWAAEGTRTDQATGSSMVATATYELIWIGHSGYTRSDGGAWIPFVGLFDHPLRLTADPDAGTFVVTDDRPDGDPALRRLGYADPSVIDPVFVLAIGNELDDVDASATYDLTADGRLVRMQSSLSGSRRPEFGGGTVRHEAEFTVLPGVPDPIEPPPTDWTLFRSTRLPFSLALPPGWSVGQGGDGVERFRSDAGTAEVRVREDPVTSSPAGLVEAVQAGYRAHGAETPSSIVPTYLGAETATAVIYPDVDLGEGPVNVVHLVSMFDGAAYDVVWTMRPGILQAQFDLIGDVATSWYWGETGS
jgi:hypothetical protein